MKKEKWKKMSGRYEISSQGRMRSRVYGRTNPINPTRTSGGSTLMYKFSSGCKKGHSKSVKSLMDEYWPDVNFEPTLEKINRIRKRNGTKPLADKYGNSALKTIPCKGCGRMFRQKHSRQLYCTLECKLEKKPAIVKATPKPYRKAEPEDPFYEICYHPGCMGPADPNYCPLW